MKTFARITLLTLFPLLLQSCFLYEIPMQIVNGILPDQGKHGEYSSFEKWSIESTWILWSQSQKMQYNSYLASPEVAHPIYTICGAFGYPDYYSITQEACFQSTLDKMGTTIGDTSVIIPQTDFDTCKTTITVPASDPNDPPTTKTVYDGPCTFALIDPTTTRLTGLTRNELTLVTDAICQNLFCLVNLVHRQAYSDLTESVRACIEDLPVPPSCLLTAYHNTATNPFFYSRESCQSTRNSSTNRQKFSDQTCWMQGSLLSHLAICPRAMEDQGYSCSRAAVGL